METSSFSDDLRRYLAVALQWGWLLALATLLAGLAAYLISKGMTPVYQASTTVLINEAPATQGADYAAVLTSERLAQTYAQLMTKEPVLEGVLDRLGLEMEMRKLKQVIDVQPVRDTTLIEVHVDDPDPQQAARLANALVAEFAEQNQAMQSSRYAASKQSLQAQLTDLDAQISANNQALKDLGDAPDRQAERDRLQANQAQYRQTYAYLLQSFEQVRLAEVQSTSSVIQAEPATPPLRPIRPRTLLNTLLASVVGLILATGVVLLIETMDDTIKTPEEVTRVLGLPVLGLIARHATEDGRPVSAAEPRSPVSEAFRSLRTNIQFASVDRPLACLLVTSPSPTEGKSTVAANLGIVMAQNGRQVAVIDADLRRPRIHTVLGLPNRNGISGLFVQKQIKLNGTLQKTSIDNLTALTAGDIPPNPAELLGSEKMFEIVAQVRTQADLVILDSPPILAVTDSVVLAPRVDGVLLVLKPDVTQMAAARQAVEQLRRAGANLLGVVLNDVDMQRSHYSYYYQGYYYAARAYTNNGARPKKRKLPLTWPK